MTVLKDIQNQGHTLEAEPGGHQVGLKNLVGSETVEEML